MTYTLLASLFAYAVLSNVCNGPFWTLYWKTSCTPRSPGCEVSTVSSTKLKSVKVADPAAAPSRAACGYR